MIFPLFLFQKLFKPYQGITFGLLIGFCSISLLTKAQQSITFGKGNTTNVTVTSSSNASNQTGIKTLMSSGYLPNKNAAARLLSQATLGTTYADIENVATNGIEKWVDQQLAMPNSFSITNYIQGLHQALADSLNRLNPNPPKTLANTSVGDYFFDVAWFQGNMTVPDLLRWRVALGLSEVFVTSRVSAFDNNPYALSSYYDVLLENSFTNYRTLIEKITYHPSMAVYLTFMNNRATNVDKQTFPDENYAREIMQLFSIGLFQLNLDGSEKKDDNGKSIPTYNNNDIANLAKVFTGLSWGDSKYLGDVTKDYWSYTKKLKFYPVDSSDAYLRYWANPNTWVIVNGHEVGSKTFLGSTILARSVQQGELDIKDALDILFNHPNVGPFIGRRLIQRLVTSNPSPAYIQRVATVFNNNGSGVRGDLKAVVRAVLLDTEARDCCNNGNTQFAGSFKEPFLRYTNLVKGLNLTATGGVFRNVMRRSYEKTGQIPMYSPSVFNFFAPDYTPDGALKGTGKFGPEFQTLNSQTLTGYLNALNSWIIVDDVIEYTTYFSGETYKSLQEPGFNLVADYPLTRNDRLPQLLDKYNLILAHGRLSQKTLDIIKGALLQMPISVTNGVPNSDDASRRVRIAIYLIMVSPDYLINK